MFGDIHNLKEEVARGGKPEDGHLIHHHEDMHALLLSGSAS